MYCNNIKEEHMTATLGSLKLTAAQKPSHITPIQQRRKKLAKRLWEQAELAKAKVEGNTFAPTKFRTITDSSGVRKKVEVSKRVKAWWFTADNGKLSLSVRYGTKLIELGKGKWAVEVASEKELAPTLELLKAAVLEGELDAAIEAAAAKLKRGIWTLGVTLGVKHAVYEKAWFMHQRIGKRRCALLNTRCDTKNLNLRRSKQHRNKLSSQVLLRLLKHLRKHVLSIWCKRYSKPKLSWIQRLQHSGWRSAGSLPRVSVASCSVRRSQQRIAPKRSAAFACRLKRQRIAACSKRCKTSQISTVETKSCLHINSASKHAAGIVKILAAHSYFLHSVPSNALHTENQNALKSLKTQRSCWGSRALIILWSTVQVRDVPPFNSTTYEPPVLKLGAFVFVRGEYGQQWLAARH
jgi:hypothetical protein